MDAVNHASADLAQITSMTKSAAIATVIRAVKSAPIVFTTGYTSRIAAAIADRPSHLYMTGSMGLSAPIATGLALATGRPALAVDGDGSVLMNPSALVLAGALAPLPLIHVVLDDGAYDSTGGQVTGSAGVDMSSWALACGYQAAHVVDTPPVLANLVANSVAHGSGPVFLHCRVTRSTQPLPGRVEHDLAEHAQRFAARLRAAITSHQEEHRASAS
jgi:sulfopyruvate decarboxylase subunit beta